MGEHYLPLRPSDLVRRMGDEPSVTIFERQQFEQLCQLIRASIHHEYHARLEQLQQAYAPFDPDDDAPNQFPVADDERAVCWQQLFAEFDALLTRANYQRLP